MLELVKTPIFMKHQILKVKTIILLVVLTVGVLALSSCGRRSGCPGMISKTQPVENTVRS